jgi:Putative beta-barrel porin-2, OmpL-like. bbp2
MKWYYLPIVTAASLAASMAFAADVASKKDAVTPPAPPPKWLDTMTIDGYVDGGIAFNFNQPWNGVNWGNLYTDRANTPTFNGLVVTAQRPIDPKSDNYDFGFKVQLQLGEDMRYNHVIGLSDYLIPSRTQFGPLEANVQAHLPWKTFLSEGGIDIKAGIFPTYNGAELMVAKDNMFYSLSYIFNFGPFLHTGVMTTTHVRDWLDFYAGVTTGVNTFIGWPGDNNASASFHGGFGLNLLEGNLTIIGFVHSGPENPKQIGSAYTPASPPFPPGLATASWPNTPYGCVCNPNSTNRTYSNLTTTWKATDRLTLVTDMAFNRESGWNPASYTGISANYYANADALLATVNPNWPGLANLPQHPKGAESYGVYQYASYKVSDLITVKGRVGYYRDAQNFFVGAYQGYFDNVNSFHGFACLTCLYGPSNNGTSYLDLTTGLTITPELPKDLPIVTGLILRPEFRWTTTTNGTHPFFSGINGPNGIGQRSTQGMFNFDAIIPFSLL